MHLRVHVGGMERVGGNVGRPLAIVRASVIILNAFDVSDYLDGITI